MSETIDNYLLEFVRKDIVNLKYKPVQSLKEIAEEVALQVNELVKLDANENSHGTLNEVHEAVEKALKESVQHYPDPTQKQLRSLLVAKVHPHLTIDHIVCGAGSDDVLDVMLRLVMVYFFVATFFFFFFSR